MQIGFAHPVFDVWAQRPLLNLAEGGAELGEIMAVCRQIPDGDRDTWHRAWFALAERLEGEARTCEASGHAISARQLYLRAATYFRASYPVWFGAPVDHRVSEGYAREAAAFAQAAALFDPPLQSLDIPLGDLQMPAWFYSGGAGSRPLLICVNGYDETLHAMHYSAARAAQARGYHVLTFDGPGQGRPLIRDGAVMRHDWEVVLDAVLDVAERIPGVDASRIAVAGWSFGGYLAPRAVAGQPRVAALIADPGQWDMLDSIRGLFRKFGAEELAEALPDVTDADLAPVMQAIEADPMLRWTVLQRGFWVHGVTSLAAYFRALVEFRLSDVAHRIACPSLIIQTEGDPIAAFASRLQEAVSGPVTMVRFTAAEGAGGHCETLARSVYHQRAYDWLDEVFDFRG